VNYTLVTFILNPVQPAQDILIAELAELGFDSFEETPQGLKAYIETDQWNDQMLSSLAARNIPNQQLSWDSAALEDKNWNAEWESNFSPILVEDRCQIRASFHAPMPELDYDILINPQMSFGTGHHETTHMMVAEMLAIDFAHKSVLDMGCGTGVLAILAEKRKASQGLAIDIDEWSYHNTLENIALNQCASVEVRLGDRQAIGKDTFDIILANINRNILIDDMTVYSNALLEGGEILFSGFYLEDRPIITEAAEKNGLKFSGERARNGWAMLRFQKAPR
jgi:ribosomal protein L11 methyltransferase